MKMAPFRVVCASLYFKVCQSLGSQNSIINKLCSALSIQSEPYVYYKIVGDGFFLKKVFFQNTDKTLWWPTSHST